MKSDDHKRFQSKEWWMLMIRVTSGVIKMTSVLSRALTLLTIFGGFEDEVPEAEQVLVLVSFVDIYIFNAKSGLYHQL